MIIDLDPWWIPPAQPVRVMRVDDLTRFVSGEMSMEDVYDWWDHLCGAVIFLAREYNRLMAKAGESATWPESVPMNQSRPNGMRIAVADQKELTWFLRDGLPDEEDSVAAATMRFRVGAAVMHMYNERERLLQHLELAGEKDIWPATITMAGLSEETKS